MKFKNYIETESGIKDTSTSPGTAGQVLSSTVTGTSWIDQDEIIAAASKLVVIACKNVSGVPILKGTPVYQSGTVGATDVIEIEPADATISTGYLPAIGILQTTLNNNIFGNVVITGEFLNYDTASIPTNNPGGVPITGDTVYLAAGGGLTCIKPTGEGNAIQNLGLIGKVSGGTAGSITVSSIMRANDVPNLPTGKIWVGDGNTIVSDTVYLDEVNNRMGIGTTLPSETLTLQTKGDGLGNEGIFIKNPFAGTTPIVDSKSPFLSLATSTTSAYNSTIYMGRNATATNQESKIEWSNANDGLSIYVKGQGSYREHVRFGDLANSTARTFFNGNVGIGTTGPRTKLHVSGLTGDDDPALGSSTAPLFVSNTANSYGLNIGVNSAGTSWLQAQSNTGPISLAMSLNPLGGNVGIGVVSPAVKLHAGSTSTSGTTTEEFRLQSGTSSGNGGTAVANLVTGNFGVSGIYFGNNTTYSSQPVYLQYQNSSNVTTLQFDNTFKIDQNASSVFYINPLSNVGIGTTSPVAKLEVEGSDHLLQLSTASSTGSPYLSFNQAGARRSFIQHNDSGDTLKIVSEYGGIDFFTGTIGVETERMTIQSGGNVGIGTTNPTGKLQVSQVANNGNTGAFTNTHVKLTASQIADNTGFVGITAATSTADNYGYSFGAQRSAGGVGSFKINYHNGIAAGVNRFIIDQNGQVGIGTNAVGISKNLTIGQISDSATDAGIFSNNQSRFYLTTATNTTASCGLHFGDSQFAEVNTRGKIEYNANVSPASNYFQFRVNFSDAMRLGLNSSGAVRAGIGTTSPSSMLQVNGGVQLANDTDTASASKVGTFRYYTSGNNSYVDMCMQTGAATYAWVNIVQNTW